MARRRFQLTEEQEKELIGAYMSCKHGPTRSRYQAVRLYGTGYPVEEVMNITGCSRTSLMEWCRSYREDGVGGLVDKRAGGNRAKLTSVQIEVLKERLHAYMPRLNCLAAARPPLTGSSGRYPICGVRFSSGME